jgi:hypothetical protein
MTIPNPKWQPDVSDTLDNAPAVDKGGDEVGLPITGHSFLAGQTVIIAGTINYDGARWILAATANEIVVAATYVAETFAGTETVLFGRQVIVKGDFRALEEGITGQPSVRLKPPLIWVADDTVRVAAAPDSPAWTAFTGMPNILNPATQVDGGLSDGKIRGITANVSCLFASGGLYGATQTEKSSQWYAIFAVAGNNDAGFELKAMPVMRVKSQTGQAIKCGTLAAPGTGINYGFTDNDLAGGKVYFQTGASRGLMRTISANDVDTDTRLTYSGDALTVAAGDWFIVLPPTNFRFLGSVFNKSSGHLRKFRRLGYDVQWLDQIALPVFGGPYIGEFIELCCPFATAANVNFAMSTGGEFSIGHAETSGAYSGQSYAYLAGTGGWIAISFHLEFCKYFHLGNGGYANSYSYPRDSGY